MGPVEAKPPRSHSKLRSSEAVWEPWWAWWQLLNNLVSMVHLVVACTGQLRNCSRPNEKLGYRISPHASLAGPHLYHIILNWQVTVIYKKNKLTPSPTKKGHVSTVLKLFCAHYKL